MQRPRINLTSTPSDAQMPEIGTTATWTPTKTCQNMWFTSLSACVKLQAYRETCGLRITIIRTLGSLSNTGVGIVFDINIPTLYGEGRRAFLRLQQELIKTSHDASILVWGGWHDRLDAPHPAISGGDMRTHFHGVMHTQRFFFAQSPRGFTRPTISYSQDLYSNPDLSKVDALVCS